MVSFLSVLCTLGILEIATMIKENWQRDAAYCYCVVQARKKRQLFKFDSHLEGSAPHMVAIRLEKGLHELGVQYSVPTPLCAWLTPPEKAAEEEALCPPII